MSPIPVHLLLLIATPNLEDQGRDILFTNYVPILL
jgi:hypothetical protein